MPVQPLTPTIRTFFVLLVLTRVIPTSAADEVLPSDHSESEPVTLGVPGREGVFGLGVPGRLLPGALAKR